MRNKIFSLTKKESLSLLWLCADFLIIWSTVYFLPSPMNDDLRGFDELPLVYNITLIPLVLSFAYFTIWHDWRDIFLKTAILYLAYILVFDWQIRTLGDIFSVQTIQLIFSEKSIELIIVFSIIILISYGISSVILKHIKK